MSRQEQWKFMEKQADSTAVPYAGSATSQASMSPVPTTAVDTKPARGQTGPKGMAPRTNYSRVNSGPSPTADLGASSQKALAPDSQSFLPHKVAHTEVHMSAVTPRMTIHDMIKAASDGAADHVAVTQEAERQLRPSAPATKVASASTLETIPTAYVEKFAEAVEFILKQAAEPGPGTGPNHLGVLEAPGGKNPFMPGNQGQATPAHIIPKNPGEHKPSETPHGPANALDDNMSMMHGKQPVKLSSAISIADMRKAASVKVAKEEKTEKEMCKGCGKEKDACSCSKTASAPAVDPRLIDLFLTTVKTAEDAINPAHISAGPAVPPETSASGQSGGEPAGGKPKGDIGLIASNDAAIKYTKGQAKAQPKAEVNKVLTEPALSAAHDKTLGMAFSHTGQAGVKISSLRSASARALLEKMAEEAEDDKDGKKKKKKESMGGGFMAPPVGGVAGAGA